MTAKIIEQLHSLLFMYYYVSKEMYVRMYVIHTDDDDIKTSTQASNTKVVCYVTYNIYINMHTFFRKMCQRMIVVTYIHTYIHT